MIPLNPTLRQLVDEGAGELRGAEGCARENPRGEASRLLEAVVGLDRAALLTRGEEIVMPPETARYREMVRSRARGVPLQLLIGETEFYEVTLAVEPGVFIPRPETELLVEEACAAVERRLHEGCSGGRPVRVLDLCTGTGAVAIAVGARFRDRSGVLVYAGDWSPRAVRLARRNAERNDVPAEVRRSNLFSAFADLEGGIDVLVANPPYIAPEESKSLPLEVRLGDPKEALVDPEGGTGFHRRIATRGRDFLRPGGILALEIGERQGADAGAILTGLGYGEVVVLPDLAGRDRFVRGRAPTSMRSS